MARLNNKALFFTTSPRTPSKMIPEIRLLIDNFEGERWDQGTQSQFARCLKQADFFEGKTSKSESAFSARDRINRAPKALGFVDLQPCVSLTAAGRALLSGKRTQEVFLRQLLKFQLPSPYHVENDAIAGTFYIRPYLEIMRLVHELEYLTFDEFKIFAIQLTDYRNFDNIKADILSFRAEKEVQRGKYKQFANTQWENAILQIHRDRIQAGKIKTRESADATLKNFIRTQKRNLHDYADACFRYMRYTGLFVFSGHSLRISDSRIDEVEHILATVDREPVFINDISAYKAYLFDTSVPALYSDIRNNTVDALMRIGGFTRRELSTKTDDELKELLDDTIQRRKEAVIHAQVEQLKSYALYSEIIDTYNEIIADEYYDAPLMFEYNTWRAMTMLDGGNIKGNFKFDDAGQPLATAAGNVPDIECDYSDFVLSVEVTLQSGQRQYESEGEPVARHYGKLKKRTGKDTYCLFIAPTVNHAAFAHFYALNKMNISYYGGKTKIIPLELDQFMRLVENSYNYKDQPTPQDIRAFLDNAIQTAESAADEDEWRFQIEQCVHSWLAA